MRLPATLPSRFALALGLAVSAATALRSPDALAAEPPVASGGSDSEAGRAAVDLMRTGMNEYRKGHFDAARAAFLRAWALKQHPAVAASLGDVEMKLALYRDAATHWTFYLANLPPGRDRSDADDALVECRKHVASVQITVDQAGGDVAIDGGAFTKTPIDAPIWLDPGAHTVTARSADGRTATEHVELKAGESRTVQLSLVQPVVAPPSSTASSPVVPSASAAPAPTPSPAPAPVRPESRPADLRIPLVITGSLLTAAAVAVGIVYSAKENQASSDVTRHESEVDQGTTDHRRATFGGCGALAPKPLPTACAALSESADTVVSSRRMKVAAFAGAGVLGIATVATYFLWPTPHERDQQAHLTLMPWNEPGQGIQLRLSF